MKLRVLSDLHLEFGDIDLQPIGEDVLVLAGDIGLHTQGAEWAIDYSKKHDGIRVVYIAGNHEFYRAPWCDDLPTDYTIDSTLAALRAAADANDNFHFLDDANASWISSPNPNPNPNPNPPEGVWFIGTTLWTDFALQGDQALNRLAAGECMNDYNLIYEDDEPGSIPHPFRPIDAQYRHEASVARLREWFYDPLVKTKAPLTRAPLVVITHHLPSARSLDGRYKTSRYNSAYASNLDELVAASGAALWVHGHTHISKDYRIGQTRVVCNPRGYVGDETNPDFNPDLIIEV